MFLSRAAARLALAVLTFLSLRDIPLHGQDFVWARQMGGPDAELGYDVTADAAGNVYVTGYFHQTADFDPGPGVLNLTSAGDNEIFVAKFDSGGNLLWAKRFGSASADYGSDIAVDAAGNVYVTGWFGGAVDFDPGAGVTTLTSAGSDDVFVLKLSANGDLVWARRMGGPGDDDAYGIAADGNGNVFVSGEFTSTVDFDPGAGVLNLTAAGSWDVFVVKLNSAGEFTWAQRMGGSGFDSSQGVAVDADGNVYTAGSFVGSGDFDPGAGTVTLTSAGEDDVFVSKLTSAGAFVWARRFGGSGDDYAYGLALDAAGNPHTNGSFKGTVDFNPGAGASNLTSAGEDDVFISKLDSAGAFVWAQRLGGTAFEFSADVAVDGNGNVYTTGLFRQTADFDPSAGASNLVSAGGDDAFVSKLNSAGEFVWARRAGGSASDSGHSVKAVGSNVYVSGRFAGTADLDPGAGVSSLASAGDNDAFVLKLTSGDGGLPPVITNGGIVLANLLPTVNTVSPRSIISVFGQNFSTETLLFPNLDGQGKLATILGGTCLMMNGTPLPIFAVTPTQINAQISANAALGPMSFTVTANCATIQAVSSAPLLLEGPAPREQTSAAEMATVQEATPAFFIFNPVASNGFIAARFNATQTQTAAAVAPDGLFNDEYGPSRPAKPGDIILLYGTGWGDTMAHLTTGQLASGAAEVLPEANRKITLGGVQLDPSDIFYVGVTPQTAGLYQAAIRIPANAPAGNQQVVLTVYGKSTPVGPVIPIAAP